MTISFGDLVSSLSTLGIDSPRLEARMMLAGVLNVDVNVIGADISVDGEQEAEVKQMLARRMKHEPLDKILGIKEFYKSSFIVNSDVLSPRPDSEILVEEAIKIAKQNNLDKIIEFGVGSGCLILSILQDVPQMSGLGFDKSEKALEIAKQNAKRLGLESRINFEKFDYFNDETEAKTSLIISNPPYIPTSDIDELDEEVKKYDPFMALDGGEDGYVHYRRIAEIAPLILEDGGYILLEGGIGQADMIAEIFEDKGLKLVAKVCDLSGIERCIILKK